MTSTRKRPPLGVTLAGAALVAALAALVLSLTGIATGLPGKNRIDKNDLRKRVVKPINVQRNAIRSFQLAPSAAKGVHIANAAVTQSKLADIAEAKKILPGVTTYAADTVDCPAGTRVISGGAAYVVANAGQDIQIRSSFRDGNGWRVAVVNNGAGAQNYEIYAYCLVG